MGESFFRIRATRHRAALAAAAGLVLVAPLVASAQASASVTVPSHFVWTASSSNTSGDSAFIVNGATNAQPGDLLFVTPNWSPNGLCGCVYQPNAIGVWYDSSNSQWAVFREDGGTMPANEEFNVLAVPRNQAGSSAFVQTATSANTSGDFTLINSSLTNSHPNVRLEVTQNWNPNGSGGTFNRHNVGVWYDSAAKEWGIFNEDSSAMTVGASFNVLVGSTSSNGGASVLLQTSASNSGGDTTFISDGQTNGNPNNVTFVTQNWNPGGVGGTYNNVQPGVWYDTTEEGVFNENVSSPPVNSAYNLLIFSS